MTIKTLESINRFDLEQEILNGWSVVDDIKTFSWKFSDSGPMSEDEVLNFMIGLEAIYQAKFEKLFNTFEQCIKNGKFDDQ